MCLVFKNILLHESVTTDFGHKMIWDVILWQNILTSGVVFIRKNNFIISLPNKLALFTWQPYFTQLLTTENYSWKRLRKRSKKQHTLLRFPVTLISLRLDFPTLKSTEVTPPSSLKATWPTAIPITHKLHSKIRKGDLLTLSIIDHLTTKTVWLHH